ncbi:toxin-antitoxin system YwqK family antitoxin [Candidatus Riflebacteria bacterium]
MGNENIPEKLKGKTEPEVEEVSSDFFEHCLIGITVFVLVVCLLFFFADKQSTSATSFLELLKTYLAENQSDVYEYIIAFLGLFGGYFPIKNEEPRDIAQKLTFIGVIFLLLLLTGTPWFILLPIFFALAATSILLPQLGIKEETGPFAYSLTYIVLLILCFTLYQRTIVKPHRDKRFRDVSKRLQSAGSSRRRPKTDGPFKTFYKGGQLKSEGTYKNKKREGLFRYWNRNGSLNHEVTYSGGKIHGQIKSYHGNGKIKEKVEYEAGKMHGYWRYYDRAGQLRRETLYLRGKVKGRSRFFDQYGYER